MTSHWYSRIIHCLGLFIIYSCSTTVPIRPKIAVMPGPGKPFDQFVIEENSCRQYAQQSIDPSNRGTSNSTVGTAIAGTALGTAAGALIGGREGASVGAGVGLLGGSAVASGQAGYETQDIQWSYDNAYAQCMYSKGNQVPGFQTQQAAPLPPPKTEHKK